MPEDMSNVGPAKDADSGSGELGQLGGRAFRVRLQRVFHVLARRPELAQVETNTSQPEVRGHGRNGPAVARGEFEQFFPDLSGGREFAPNHAENPLTT